eukprot:GHVR01113445.1.p1 GENE.GHVR01113445.1~~GHVR01113445.1.p1  ORF type:complete len:144 (-),score=76.58 GHVR01113445.1:10-441(-)
MGGVLVVQWESAASYHRASRQCTPQMKKRYNEITKQPRELHRALLNTRLPHTHTHTTNEEDASFDLLGVIGPGIDSAGPIFPACKIKHNKKYDNKYKYNKNIHTHTHINKQQQGDDIDHATINETHTHKHTHTNTNLNKCVMI